MGNDTADGERLLHAQQEPDRVPGGHPAGAVLRPQLPDFVELWSHGRGHGSRTDARFRRPGSRVRQRRRPGALVEQRHHRTLPETHPMPRQPVRLLHRQQSDSQRQTDLGYALFILPYSSGLRAKSGPRAAQGPAN